jgi:adenosylcobinamide kinase/adenosylcobinamide-phosphate guanylyltransferase
MARIVLVTGGCRSGKSTYAQALCQGLPGRKVFIATCPVVDEEMRRRIRRHQEVRPKDWDTVEEPTALAGATLAARQYDVVLVDCLTLWVNNLLYEAGRPAGPLRGHPAAQLDEEHVAECCQQVLAACGEHPGTVVFVSNEVGMGIVPENAQARLFRDLLGRCNQMVAGAADTVVLMVSGIPVPVKGSTKAREPASPTRADAEGVRAVGRGDPKRVPGGEA